MNASPIDPDEFVEDLVEAVRLMENCNTTEAIKHVDRQIEKLEELLRHLDAMDLAGTAQPEPEANPTFPDANPIISN